jgi:hypothetical protein
VSGWQARSRHTAADTWPITLSKTPALTGGGAHELSKFHVTVARWSAERIGPTIIAAPQRGQADVARAGVSVVGGTGVSVVCADGEGVARRVRTRATRATRQVFARNPDWRIRTKPRGRMCWTKRRRNSIAVSVIVRRWSPRA